MRASALLSARTVRALDAALAGWTVLWLALAVLTAYQLRQLGELADSAVAAADALEETATALGALSGLPIVGEEIGEIEDRVARAAVRARADARGARGDIDLLALLLGAGIALVPTVPALAAYLPLRRAWTRERAAVGRALRDGDPGLDAFLARQAHARLPFGAGEHHDERELAQRELERFGLRRAERGR